MYSVPETAPRVAKTSAPKPRPSETQTATHAPASRSDSTCGRRLKTSRSSASIVGTTVAKTIQPIRSGFKNGPPVRLPKVSPDRAHEAVGRRHRAGTRPTSEMRRAMAEAELGDDVFGDDPTVIELEERAAELTAKEAALFVASGTMGNLVCEMVHVRRGGEIIVPAASHTIYHEAANYAVVVGASMRTVPWDANGRMALDDIRNAFRNPDDVHDPLTALVVVENTHSDSM